MAEAPESPHTGPGRRRPTNQAPDNPPPDDQVRHSRRRHARGGHQTRTHHARHTRPRHHSRPRHSRRRHTRRRHTGPPTQQSPNQAPKAGPQNPAPKTRPTNQARHGTPNTPGRHRIAWSAPVLDQSGVLACQRRQTCSPSSRPMTSGGSLGSSSPRPWSGPSAGRSPSSSARPPVPWSSRTTCGSPRRNSPERWPRGSPPPGLDVVNAGLASTDLLYYASGSLNLPGAMFTASHNPARYNGIKLCLAGAVPLSLETGLATIRDDAMAILDGASAPLADTPGTVTSRSLLADYAEYLRGLVDLSAIRPLHVVVDAGNGMAGLHRARGVRRTAAASRPAVLRPRRQFPQPRGQPAGPGEPGRPAGRGASAPAPTSGSRSTATPTGASSSTRRASRCRPAPSPHWSPSGSWPRPLARRSSTT